MQHQKRVAAIHDLSGVGKCSLTVAIPVLSAAGLECCPLPTAVLSTHTGGFKDFTFFDLTAQILPIANHWAQEGFEFSAIYTGYLGSQRQVELVRQAVQKIGRGAKIIVDPVMGDNGKLYQSFSNSFPLKMRELCAVADALTPNITEACLLLGQPFLPPPHSQTFLNGLLEGLRQLCRGTVILTGVSLAPGQLGALLAEPQKPPQYLYNKRLQGTFHGTGDLFASTLTAALVRGFSAEQAVRLAVDFTLRCIETTVQKYPDLWYGVAFEDELEYFIKQVKEYGK